MLYMFRTPFASIIGHEIVQCSTDLGHLNRIYSTPTHDKTPVATVTVYSAHDDGGKGRPKHVEYTCSC